MELEQTHKDKFKVKSICTNQKMKWLMQIKTKWCTNESCATQLINKQHDPNLGGIHYFPLYSIHCEQWWALCWNEKKSRKNGTKNFQVMNLATLWTYNLTYKFQLRSIQRKSYNPWKQLFNTILHALIWGDLTLFLGFNGWESNCQFDF
jgi:hypothetical protein